ncbi:MAG: protein-L-isoaspartate(D-aspartate) O-methyltransferase [Deltaproteobacteria bacterium]|nr:protein-L-isoaspartate(D-aspartate) O-methyltransferase [Deltaproteobacteria bacterium]
MRFSFLPLVLTSWSSIAGPEPAESKETIAARELMVRTIETRGITDARVLDALRKTPRHLFVPAEYRSLAYSDRPLPIGSDQTISQPYIVAIMTELARPTSKSKALEIGTGSGYQAAVLSKLVRSVHSIEIVPELADRARKDLAALGYSNVTVITGDGYRGLPKEAPFDVILVTAAPSMVPQPLVDQLAVGGRLVIPVGSSDQELILIERTAAELVRKSIIPVMFVPMTGEAAKAKVPEVDPRKKSDP